ncbi:hypothetical protein CSKR_105607 [Clonorchis sinensis]|uniref:Uncharacterized protein n=1 Tax=Clonorchis sinensis TaxID=79923 RepID=A0A3R7FC59_CLOSI|nr:hypothetical protein CSKR_105607 [Clonorchis sinensis]
MYIRNPLLIRLLKILRQPTTGFALVGAHQVDAVFVPVSNLMSSALRIYMYHDISNIVAIKVIFREPTATVI